LMTKLKGKAWVGLEQMSPEKLTTRVGTTGRLQPP